MIARLRHRLSIIGVAFCLQLLSLLVCNVAVAQRVRVVPANQGQADSRKNSDAPTPPTNQDLSRTAQEFRLQLSEQKLASAIPLAQEIFDQPNDAYALVAGKPELARRWVESILTDNAAALAEYRKQFDDEANYELKNAGSNLDKLARVARRFFPTQAGVAAIDKLATLLLDAGQPALASVYWERIADSPIHKSFISDATRAKWALAVSLAGNPTEIDSILGPAKSVRLNGSLLSANDFREAADFTRHIVVPDANWEMFGGNSLRSQNVISSQPLLCAELRSVTLPFSANEQIGRHVNRILEGNRVRNRPTLFGTFPIAVGDAVVYRGSSNVSAIDINKRKTLWPSSYQQGAPFDKQKLNFDEWDSPSQMTQSSFESMIVGNSVSGTLSSDGDRVYFTDEVMADPGSQSIFFGSREKEDDVIRDGNRLVALDAQTGKPVWFAGGRKAREANEPIGRTFFFGAPLPYRDRLFVLGEHQAEIGLYEFDPGTGKQLWRQSLTLMTRRIDVDPYRRSQQCPIGAADGIAVCVTNTQKVFGVDLVLKTLLWEADFDFDQKDKRYLAPQFVEILPPPTDPFAVDPPMIVDSKVIVSGPQWHSVHCLDIRSGKRLWTAPRENEHYVAGVSEGVVVLVGIERIRGLDLATGAEKWNTPISLPCGRGVFVREADSHGSPGDARQRRAVYYVPLESGGIAVIEVANGRRLPGPIMARDWRTPLGNLIAIDRAIVSAGRNGMRVFPTVARSKSHADELLAKQKDDPRGLFLLGAIAFSEGKSREASEMFTKALKVSETFDARDQTIDLALRIADRDGRKNPKEYRPLLAILKKSANMPALSAAVERLEAEILAAEGNWIQAIKLAELQMNRISESENTAELESGIIQNPKSWARSFVRRTLDAIPADRKPAVESQLKKDKERLFAAATPDALHKSAQLFGHCDWGRSYWFEAGKRLLANRRLADARRSFDYALASATDAADRSKILVGLADVAKAGEMIEDDYVFVQRAIENVIDPKEKAALQDRLAKSQFARPAPVKWERDKVKVSTDYRAYNYSERMHSSGWIAPSGHPSPSLKHLCVNWVHNGERLSVYCIDARTSGRIASFQIPYLASADDAFSREGSAMVQGTTLFLGVDRRIFAFDLHGPTTSHLWTLFPFGETSDTIESNDLDALLETGAGPATIEFICAGPDFVVVRQGDSLATIDVDGPRVCWRYPVMPPKSYVFGDQSAIIVAEPPNRFRIFRPSDGTLLESGTADWSAHAFARRIFGRRILIETHAAPGIIHLSMWDPLEKKAIWTKSLPSGAKLFRQAGKPITVLLAGGKLLMLDEQTGSTVFETPPLENAKNIASVEVVIGDSLTYVFEEHRNTRRMFRIQNRLPATQINGGAVSVFQTSSGTLLWRKPLLNAHVFTWPLDAFPVVMVVSTERLGGLATLFGAEQTTSISAIDKETGKQLAKSNFPNDFGMIGDMSFRVFSTRGRLSIKGLTNEVSVTIPITPPPSNGKSDPGGTIEDVGKTLGEWFDSMRSEEPPPTKTSKAKKKK